MTTLRQTLSRGVFAAAAATGILSLSCSSALADTNAAGATSDSPGVAAGNSVQVPLDVPVNLCGNTVDAAAALNSAFGNACVNTSCASEEQSSESSYGDADDAAKDDTPESSYGDADDAAKDDTPESTDGSQTSPSTDDCATPPAAGSPTQPPTRSRSRKTPRPTPSPKRSRHVSPPAAHEQTVKPPQLAETGNKTMLATSAASVALITGGVMLYRRGRSASRR